MQKEVCKIIQWLTIAKGQNDLVNNTCRINAHFNFTYYAKEIWKILS